MARYMWATQKRLPSGRFGRAELLNRPVGKKDFGKKLIRIQIDYEEVFDAINDFVEQLYGTVENKLQEIARLVILEAKKRAPEGAGDHEGGHIKDSLQSSIAQKASSYVLTIEPDEINAKRYKFIRFGTSGGHHPPIRRIAAWMRAKGIGEGDGEAGFESALYKISSAIFAEGTKGKDNMLDSLEFRAKEIAETVFADLSTLVARVAARTR